MGRYTVAVAVAGALALGLANAPASSSREVGERTLAPVSAAASGPKAATSQTQAAGPRIDPLGPVENPAPLARSLWLQQVHPFSSAPAEEAVLSGQLREVEDHLAGIDSRMKFTLGGFLPPMSLGAQICVEALAVSAQTLDLTALRLPGDDILIRVFHYDDCPWAGYAAIGGLWTLIGNASPAGLDNVGVVGHELGHNLGLPHAPALSCPAMRTYADESYEECKVEEYWDFSDIMGAARASIPRTGMGAVHRQVLGIGDGLGSLDASRKGSAVLTLHAVEKRGQRDGFIVNTGRQRYLVSLRAYSAGGQSEYPTIRGVHVHELNDAATVLSHRAVALPPLESALGGMSGAHWLLDDGALAVLVTQVSGDTGKVQISFDPGARGTTTLDTQAPLMVESPRWYSQAGTTRKFVNPGSWIDTTYVDGYTLIGTYRVGKKTMTLEMPNLKAWDSGMSFPPDQEASAHPSGVRRAGKQPCGLGTPR